MGDIETILLQYNEVDEMQYSITVSRKVFNVLTYLPKHSHLDSYLKP